MSRPYGSWNDQNLNPDNYPSAMSCAYAYHDLLKAREQRAQRRKRRHRR